MSFRDLSRVAKPLFNLIENIYFFSNFAYWHPSPPSKNFIFSSRPQGHILLLRPYHPPPPLWLLLPQVGPDELWAHRTQVGRVCVVDMGICQIGSSNIRAQVLGSCLIRKENRLSWMIQTDSPLIRTWTINTPVNIPFHDDYLTSKCKSNECEFHGGNHPQ